MNWNLPFLVWGLGGMPIVNSFTGAGPIAQKWQSRSIGKRPWQLRWKPVCASTEIELSDWLKQKPLIDHPPRAFIAARQTHGIGQQGRVWEAPFGGVWISAAFPLSGSGSKKSPGLLGLAIAVALAHRLENFFVPVRIKWPNDLMIGEKKLAGFLPRLIHRGEALRLGRVGLGLNVSNRVPEGAISLAEILRPTNCCPLQWAAEVLLALEDTAELLGEGEFVCSESERLLWSKEVKDPQTGEILQIEGLNMNGALKLRNGSNKICWNRWQ